jgi:site-specific recombinase XerD
MMTAALVPTDRLADWKRLKALVLDTVSSPITKRVYNMALDEFFTWFADEPRPGFNKAVVNAWRTALEKRGIGPISINIRLTAVRKLAVEAADNGLVAAEMASAISRVKGVSTRGVRTGNWLSLQQAQSLLNAPDTTTKKGLRDRAMLGVLIGCGLRRSEAASLTVRHIQQRDNRWCIVDLVGKHGRIRTVPMPTWAKTAIDHWTTAAKIGVDHVFRPVSRGGQVSGERMTEKTVYHVLRSYAKAVGIPALAPHDLRRTCAKLCRAAGGELEQIQMLLGHASVQTKERYLGTKQDLTHAPNDGIKLKLAI